MRGSVRRGRFLLLFSLVDEGTLDSKEVAEGRGGSHVRVSHDSLGARTAGGPSVVEEWRFSLSTTLHRHLPHPPHTRRWRIVLSRSPADHAKPKSRSS